MNGRSVLRLLRRVNLLSSVRGKINFILLVMTLTAGSAGYSIYKSFDEVALDVLEMKTDNLPKLAQSSALISAAAKTKEVMFNIMNAHDAEDLKIMESRVIEALSRLKSAISGLPVEEQEAFDEARIQVEQTLLASIQARETANRNSLRVAEMITEFQNHAADLETIMLNTSDTAYFDIAVKGAETIDAVEATMTDLVGGKAASLQLVLEIRSEINLMSGMAVALATTNDRSMVAIISDIYESSQGRLSSLMEAFESLPLDPMIGSELDRVVETLNRVVSNAKLGRRVNHSMVLGARQTSDAALSVVVDDMVFELTIAADDATTANRETIQSLLDQEVAFLNELLSINTKLSTLQVEVMKVVNVPDVEGAKTGRADIASAAQALSNYRSFAGGRFSSDIDGLIAIADIDNGLASYRIHSLMADEAALQAAEATSKAVLKIEFLATLRGVSSQDAITNRAANISEAASEVQNNLITLGWLAALFVLCTLVLNHYLIVKPLKKISLTTERMSQGDMRPVKGFDRSSDEIRRIAAALRVFRDGLVEKEELSRISSEERAETQAQQSAAVSAVGQGLAHLSKGDLTFRIEEELTDSFAQLKQDFNVAAETLSFTVVDVISLAESIRNSSREISQASDDLANRTENQAATLEETATSLEGLTVSVRSVADGAGDASSTTQDARCEATESGKIVHRAVEAMKDIEASSHKISDIVGLIDDIAFQTNLLALNAGVEAARAGDAGRGFAVVASEVRGLSQRTTEAAGEIKTLISKSSDQVEQGVELVDRAGSALQNIVDRVSHISSLVDEIAKGTRQQATGLAEVNKSVSGLDMVTQQNAAMVEETNAAGHLLNSDAERLVTLMAEFRVLIPGSSVIPAKISGVQK